MNTNTDAPAAPTIATVTPAEAEVLAVLDRLYDAWVANDADAFAALYTDDATVVRPGSFNEGRDEVRASMAAAFAGPMKGSRAVDTPHSVRFYGPDTAIVISVAGILMAGETTLAPERLRRATWTLTRSNGRWMIAAYHNADAG